jgi:dynein heavy chain 1, cytosolic
MMEVTSPGGSPSANGLAAGASGGYQIDPLLILDHLTQVCEITLGASKKELENVGSLLSKARVSDTTQRVQRWAESQAVLYLQKDIASGDVLDGPLDGTSTYFQSRKQGAWADTYIQVLQVTTTVLQPTFPSPLQR